MVAIAAENVAIEPREHLLQICLGHFGQGEI